VCFFLEVVNKIFCFGCATVIIDVIILFRTDFCAHEDQYSEGRVCAFPVGVFDTGSGSPFSLRGSPV
jgi:hypothetical protein